MRDYTSLLPSALTGLWNCEALSGESLMMNLISSFRWFIKLIMSRNTSRNSFSFSVSLRMKFSENRMRFGLI